MRETASLFVLFVIAGCGLFGAGRSGGGAADGSGAAAVTVMTRNMYVGADVDRVLAGAASEALPVLVAEAWETLLYTNYPERARALAREIARAQPHLVGLQEVSLIRTQSPGDAVQGGTTAAEEVAFDFVPTLLDALADLGQDYRVAAHVQGTDAEMPRLNPDGTFTDVRLTDFDAILARADVRVAGVAARNYEAAVRAPGVAVLRGWIAVDAAVQGRTFRFVSTHLESAETAGGAVQRAQTQELIAVLSGETRPLILVGDLNTDAPGGAAYGLLRDAGFTDVWTLRPGPPDPGSTCCQAADLSNEASLLDRRLDLVLVRDGGGRWPASAREPVRAWRVGAEPQDRTPSGLWPSDHAGVVARLPFPVPGGEQ